MKHLRIIMIEDVKDLLTEEYKTLLRESQT